jgi:hypothetical protein
MESLNTDSVESLRLPLLLTVEEAGAVLRIGRTKAYAMAREWRDTDGRSGLPVIDLGHVLRVPRHALEEMVGTDLSDVPIPQDSDPGEDGSPSNADALVEIPEGTPQSRGRQKPNASQLDLFHSRSDPA